MRNTRPILVVLAFVSACPAAETEDPFNELNKDLAFDADTGTLTLTDNGATLTANLSSLKDDGDADSTNEALTSVELDGTELVLTEGGDEVGVDLASLVPPPQDITYDDTSRVLSISDGSSVQLPPAQTLAYNATVGALFISEGNHVFLPVPIRIFLVPLVGGPFENGLALRAMYDAIVANEQSPALLKIEPGIYDLGQQTLNLRPFIDIEGSGPGVTILNTQIQGTGDLPPAISSSVGVTMRDLRIHATHNGINPGNRIPHVIHVSGTAGMRLENVHVTHDQGFGGPPIALRTVPTTAFTGVELSNCDFDIQSGTLSSALKVQVGAGTRLIARNSVLGAMQVDGLIQMAGTQFASMDPFNVVGGAEGHCVGSHIDFQLADADCFVRF